MPSVIILLKRLRFEFTEKRFQNSPGDGTKNNVLKFTGLSEVSNTDFHKNSYQVYFAISVKRCL